MFLCRSEDELNFDQFETDLEYDDDDDSAFVIKNVAASLVGEHNCVFLNAPPQFQRKNVKLMVTTEANALNQVENNSEFKAELMVDHSVLKTTRFNKEFSINCPKSGNIFD